jgi:hypothetical protein
MQTDCEVQEVQTDTKPDWQPVDTAPVNLDAQVPPTEAAAPVKKRRRRTWIGFFRDILLYVFLYIVVSGISIGPLFWVWFGAMYADGPKWVARLYMPLAVLCELCPPLGRLINAWVNWWIL